MDYRLEHWINAPAGNHPAIDAVMIAAARWGEALFIGVVVAWFLAGWLLGRPRDRQGAITALSAAALALLANQAIIHLWARPRPFVAHPDSVHLLLAHTSDPSFPSDHASPAFAIAFVLVWFHRRVGAAILSLATLMCIARVYVGDHYPGDVAAGAVVGLVVAVLLLTVLNPVMGTLERATSGILSTLHLPARTSRREYPLRASIDRPGDEPATAPAPVPAGRTEQ